MKKILLAASSLFFLACGSSRNSAQTDQPVQVQKIWSEAEHSAFTGLVRFNNAFFCAFREASKHVGGTDGKIRVIRSADGKNWESVALLSKPLFDLRDPQLSVTPDNKIMLSIGGSIYDQQERSKLLGMRPLVSFSDASGRNFSEPGEITVEPKAERDWIWRTTWHKGTGYGIDYANKKIELVKTTDGKNFQRVAKLDIDGMPNESTIRFDKNDQMYVLVRREEGDQMGMIAKSQPPYNQFTYHKMTMRLGGPNFLFSPDGNRLFIGSRLYSPGLHETGIVITDLDGKIIRTIKLPSKGDTSYPGMVIYDGKLWVSYYSSHEDKSSIYFTSFPLKQLKG